MTQQETLSILRYIVAAYSKFEITEDRIIVWSEMLKDSSFQQSLAKVKKHVQDHKFPPSIAEIIAREEPKDEMQQKFKQWEEEAKRDREHGDY